jgi:ClpX C4-type zinc finger protein
MMSDRSDAWNGADQAGFSRVQEFFVDEKYRDSLIAASNLLARAEETAQSGVRRALLEFIRECAHELLPTKEESKAEPSCSFCGRAPPNVRLGAGASAFICNECVDLFSKVFNEPRLLGDR